MDSHVQSPPITLLEPLLDLPRKVYKRYQTTLTLSLSRPFTASPTEPASHRDGPSFKIIHDSSLASQPPCRRPSSVSGSVSGSNTGSATPLATDLEADRHGNGDDDVDNADPNASANDDPPWNENSLALRVDRLTLSRGIYHQTYRCDLTVSQMLVRGSTLQYVNVVKWPIAHCSTTERMYTVSFASRISDNDHSGRDNDSDSGIDTKTDTDNAGAGEYCIHTGRATMVLTSWRDRDPLAATARAVGISDLTPPALTDSPQPTRSYGILTLYGTDFGGNSIASRRRPITIRVEIPSQTVPMSSFRQVNGARIIHGELEDLGSDHDHNHNKSRGKVTFFASPEDHFIRHPKKGGEGARRMWAGYWDGLAEKDLSVAADPSAQTSIVIDEQEKECVALEQRAESADPSTVAMDR